MCRSALAVGVSLLLIGCGVKRGSAVAPLGVSPASIHLKGRFGSAHACALTPRRALTAAHVTDHRPFDGDVPLYPYRWSDDGASGVAMATGVRHEADIGWLVSEVPFTHPAKRAAGPPKVGEQVCVTGYDWRSAKKAYAPRAWCGPVLRVVASHVVAHLDADPGSSGSCMTNARGEVVAINVSSPAPFGTVIPVAVGVGVWGALVTEPSEASE